MAHAGQHVLTKRNQTRRQTHCLVIMTQLDASSGGLSGPNQTRRQTHCLVGASGWAIAESGA